MVTPPCDAVSDDLIDALTVTLPYPTVTEVTHDFLEETLPDEPSRNEDPLLLSSTGFDRSSRDYIPTAVAVPAAAPCPSAVFRLSPSQRVNNRELLAPRFQGIVSPVV